MTTATSATNGWAGRLQGLNRYRTAIQVAVDVALWAFSIVVVVLLRYDGTQPSDLWTQLAVLVAIVTAAQMTFGFFTSLYRVRWRVGSFEEISALALVAVLVTVVLTGYVLAFRRHPVPLGGVLGAGPMSLVLAAGVRCAWRLNRERQLRPTDQALRAVVFGAGEGGVQVITSLLTDPHSPYVPVALLDDDPFKRNSRVRHLRVSGTREDLPEVAARERAETLIIAIPSAPGTLIRELSELARSAGLTVKVLPPTDQLLSSITVDDIRPVTEADLLGRRVIDTEIEAVAGYLTGRRVLVTGAGGSIGSELCRQIHRFAPSQLVMLDRDESGLHQVQLVIHGRALLDDRCLAVCDIRDQDALQAVFDEHRPEVVFHAAALKHLPLLEMWPAEAVKTNVQGTQNVLEAAARVGVERFVNISTDKAANPVSVLGYSKRLAEGLTSAMGEREPGVYLSVRFGNVLASRGSVLTSFQHQLQLGGPITITHPEVTRYFMTVEEAVQLVVQAGAVGGDGEVLVLDMGEPVKIADVAERLILESGRPIQIVYTGLRSGEKLHEDLFGEGEVDQRRVHPLISHVKAPAIGEEAKQLLRSACNLSLTEIVGALRFGCGTMFNSITGAVQSREATTAVSTAFSGARSSRPDRD